MRPEPFRIAIAATGNPSAMPGFYLGLFAPFDEISNPRYTIRKYSIEPPYTIRKYIEAQVRQTGFAEDVRKLPLSSQL